MRKSIAKKQLLVWDCLSGKRSIVQKTPYLIGSSPAADFHVEEDQCPPVACTINNSNSHFEFRLNAEANPILDGESASHFQMPADEEHTLILGKLLIACKVTEVDDTWEDARPPQTWQVFDGSNHSMQGPFDLFQLRQSLSSPEYNQSRRFVLLPSGLTSIGFFLEDARRLLGITHIPAEAPQNARSSEDHETSVVNSEYGEFTCPVCWFKFDRGDAMNIAVHGSLRGDAHLGEEHMQRFHATRFNDKGQALDPMGLAAPDLACPHCRRKLPPAFFDLPHHIFSIVGAPSSGKSYYLSVLVKVLQGSLFKNFRITFRDADPSENVILNQMKNQLFSAASPEDAFLAKTELEGSLYETLPRQGRKVRLPKPFIFRLSQQENPDAGFSVVFYDNAGEHFEPTANSADSPGAQHIAVASGIFFLFDPLHNTEFRSQLGGVADPQLHSRRLDQQDVILAESEVRIKNILGLDAREQVATPLAVMVGKCDTWLHLLGDKPLQPAVIDKKVRLSNIADNSNRIRQLLMEICPFIVGNAEAISTNVCYFAISSLGCSPVEFTDREGHQRIGPDPARLNPRDVDVPTLWVLSQVAPDMIPSEPIP